MKPIFLVTVFLCLLVAAKVDAAALDETCTPANGAQGDCADANAICPAATAKCQCKPGYNAPSGTCAVIDQGKVNAACDAAKPCTGNNVVCTGGFCTCKDGFSGNKGDADCTSNKGVALGQVSLWTLCITILCGGNFVIYPSLNP